MDTVIEKVSRQFAGGHFKSTYHYMADDVQWNIIGGPVIKGKKEMILFCDKMDIEMAGTIVTTTDYIADGNTVAIQGYCNATKFNKQQVKLEFCEVYLFKEEQLQQITTYCVEIAL